MKQERHRGLIACLIFLSLLPCAPARADEATTGARSLPAIKTQAEFDTLARINTDTGYALPHVLFVIDRRDKNKIYYVNSKRYRFHKDFVNGTYLSLERGQEFFENNYLKPNRRFIMDLSPGATLDGSAVRRAVSMAEPLDPV